jgi:hypothetical protein
MKFQRGKITVPSWQQREPRTHHMTLRNSTRKARTQHDRQKRTIECEHMYCVRLLDGCCTKNAGNFDKLFAARNLIRLHFLYDDSVLVDGKLDEKKAIEHALAKYGADMCQYHGVFKGHTEPCNCIECNAFRNMCKS